MSAVRENHGHIITDRQRRDINADARGIAIILLQLPATVDSIYAEHPGVFRKVHNKMGHPKVSGVQDAQASEPRRKPPDASSPHYGSP